MATKKHKLYKITREQRLLMVDKLDLSEHDKYNLKFLMSCTSEELDVFLRQATQDDIDYAQELFKIGNSQIAKQLYIFELESIIIGSSLNTIQPLDNIKEVDEAKDYLKKFTLKGDCNGNTGKNES